jgi:hypothetical protein
VQWAEPLEETEAAQRQRQQKQRKNAHDVWPNSKISAEGSRRKNVKMGKWSLDI